MFIDMKENTRPKRSALIIGGMQGIGREFAKLAVEDHDTLLLIDEQESSLHAVQQELQEAFPIEVYVSEENLSLPGSADEIYTDSLLYRHLNHQETYLDLVINVLEFKMPPADVDIWETDGLSSHFSISTLIDINRLFFTDMLRRGQGEILNVISKPETMSEEMEEMYYQTQALLLEFSHDLNQSASNNRTGIHTMCTTENSFMLQAGIVPEHVAHDLMPPSCSAKEIAGYGYQVVNQERRSRGTA